MESKQPSQPLFDWHSEQSGQKRDLTRFSGELGRVLSLRGSSSATRTAAARVRERWESLVRRLEGRWARGREAWDRLTDSNIQLRAERAVLDALVAYDESLEQAGDLDDVLGETVQVVLAAIPVEGVIVSLAELGGKSRQATSEKRSGRSWPQLADRSLAERLLTGVANGTRITIEGRPVGSGPREQNRIAHWLAVGVVHEGASYGAIVVGRRASDDAFGKPEIRALNRIARRLGRALVARVGVGVTPVLGAGPKPEGFTHLWGESPAFRRALALAARLAVSDSSVVIEGELGTGRETLARAMHNRSARADNPFIVLRGSGLPEEIVARQLFGVVESSPDGSANDQPGDLDLAAGGTLYIDELADLDPVVQVRMVRLLNERTFERVGDRRAHSADVRIVAATTANLEEILADGRIREDLYYLMTAARITLPPLRERSGDIAELSRRFAIAAGRKAGKVIEGIDADAAHVLTAAPFPGNVRQLAQIIERAAYLSSGPLLQAMDLPGEVGAPVLVAPMDATTWVEQVARAVRQAVAAGSAGDYESFQRARKLGSGAVDGAFTTAVQKAVGRNPSRAARHCGIHRAQWWRLLRARLRQSEELTPADTASASGSDKTRN